MLDDFNQFVCFEISLLKINKRSKKSNSKKERERFFEQFMTIAICLPAFTFYSMSISAQENLKIIQKLKIKKILS